MKKIIFAAFIAFWASVLTLLAVNALAPDQPAPAAETLPTYTLDDVAEHNSLDDCWMAIEGKVYDFTDYIPLHPTPPAVMERWCGREATEGMRTKGYGRDHSTAAWAMMEPYLIGRLAE
jgi:hypothetical protein